jgi:hypothetical protein
MEDVAIGAIQRLARVVGEVDRIDRVLRQVGAETRLGQPDGISPSRMAEMLEVDKAGPKVRC